MNRPSDIDARLAAWVDQGPTGGPDEVLSQALAHALSTHQDRGWLDRLTYPMRFQPMHTMLKIAAVAILALAVGVVLDPLRPSTPYAATGPSPSPSPSPVALPEGDLEAGTTYAISEPAWAGVVLTVPAPGWFTIGPEYLGKNDSGDPNLYDVALLPAFVGNLHADPCRWRGSVLDPPVGPTVDDLATALMGQPAQNASAVSDVTLGGYAGKKVVMSIPDGVDRLACDDGDYGRWYEDDPGGYAPYTYGAGQVDTLYILDVDGTRRLVDAIYLPGTSEADIAELQSVVDSIRFEPIALPSPSARAT